MPEKKLTVFGVLHSVREYPRSLRKETFRLFKPIPEVAALFKELKSRNIKSVGIESPELTGRIDRNEPIQRYFESVRLMAERNGIVLVPLETGSDDSHLRYFCSAVEGIKDGYIVALKLREEDELSKVPKANSTVFELKDIPKSLDPKKIRLFWNLFYKKHSRMRLMDLTNLVEGIAFERSLTLHDRAVQNGLQYVIMGDAHAQDLHREGLIDYIPIMGSRYSRKLRENHLNQDYFQLRKSAYEKYGGLIKDYRVYSRK